MKTPSRRQRTNLRNPLPSAKVPIVSISMLIIALTALGLHVKPRCVAPVSSATATAGSATTAVAPRIRVNPLSDRFEVLCFHHVELYCADASSTAGRFAHGLGMDLLATSSPATGNPHFVSHVIGSGDIRFAFTAPLPDAAPAAAAASLPGLASAVGFDASTARAFLQRHGGVAVRAVCIRVADVAAAYAACLDGGAEGVLPPRRLHDDGTSSSLDAAAGDAAAPALLAEVRLYGDVVLRLLSLRGDDECGAVGTATMYLPGYVPTSTTRTSPPKPPTFGLARFDHIVGNVWEMLPTIERLKRITGFHEFAEFTTEDVGTIDSGLNSMVLASNNQKVLLPINEPTYGTRRRSQIETYLIANGGEGVQHMALATNDIFATVSAIRAASARGGFTLMDPPSDGYYAELPARIGDALPAADLQRARELGILVDRDDQGVLLQVFTRPVGDRPTLFLEIIQRVGCLEEAPGGGGRVVQRGGCGGFGKGNFRELFKSVEAFERTLDTTLDIGQSAAAVPTASTSAMLQGWQLVVPAPAVARAATAALPAAAKAAARAANAAYPDRLYTGWQPGASSRWRAVKRPKS